MTIEQQAWNHIHNYHLSKDGTYRALLEWSTPVEEVARLRSIGICKHSLSVIYCEFEREKSEGVVV